MIVTYEKKRPLDDELKNFILTRIDFDEGTKELKGFCIILLHFCGEEVREIVKFDTAHNKCHIHKYFKENYEVETLNRRVSQESFNEFRKEISDKWEEYLKKYKRHLERKVY